MLNYQRVAPKKTSNLESNEKNCQLLQRESLSEGEKTCREIVLLSFLYAFYQPPLTTIINHESWLRLFWPILGGQYLWWATRRFPLCFHCVLSYQLQLMFPPPLPMKWSIPLHFPGEQDWKSELKVDGKIKSYQATIGKLDGAFTSNTLVSSLHKKENPN